MNIISQEDAAEAFRGFSDHQKLFSPPRSSTDFSERTDEQTISPLTHRSGHTMEHHIPQHGNTNSNIIHHPEQNQISEDDEEQLYANYSYSFDMQVKDCTDTIHQMHEALLYILSNPSEFEAAISYYNSKMTTSTLSEFHDEYDRSTEIGDDSPPVPLPFVVFTDDAEVVLPQAHTASQLFGVEREVGMELEAATGVIGLSQLFCRWLALMPGGDHMNIINPPGLTIMRISGGRYRVTAAHRVVWTWNNEFLSDPTSDTTQQIDQLHFGDMVTMTIVDVFETDSHGKLLSYCPTFDNRAVKKTDARVERLRKGSSRMKSQINVISKSRTAAKVNEAAGFLGRLSMKAATTVKDTIQKTVEEERRKKNVADEIKRTPSQSNIKSIKSFEKVMGDAEAEIINSAEKEHNMPQIQQNKEQTRGEMYISGDSEEASR